MIENRRVGFWKGLITVGSRISSMRMIFLFCIAVLILSFSFLHVFLSIKNNKFEDIPLGYGTAFIGALSLFIAGKVSQSVWGEKQSPDKIGSVVSDVTETPEVKK